MEGHDERNHHAKFELHAMAYLIGNGKPVCFRVFPFGIIQAVVAVAIFFFICVGDPKRLLSQSQKFDINFLKKLKKGGF